MPLKLENLVAELTPTEINDIIIRHFRQEGYQASDLKVIMKNESQGVGVAEKDVTVFKGISVTLKPKRAERRDEGFERM